MKKLYVILFALALALPVQASFSVTKSTVGFEPYQYMTPPRIVPMVGAPSEAFTKGQPLVLNALGYVTAAANGSANIVGVAMETKTMAASTSADDHTLLVETNLSGTLWKANLDAAGWLEDAVATAVASAGTSIAFGAGLTTATADDNANGHALVCYSGTCRGQWRYVIDYDASGHATGEQAVLIDRPFDTLPTTSSYFILLGTGTANQGIVEGGHIDLGSTAPSKLKGTDYAGALLVVSLEHVADGVLIVKFTDTVEQAP
jgi:hypothetical protein